MGHGGDRAGDLLATGRAVPEPGKQGLVVLLLAGVAEPGLLGGQDHVTIDSRHRSVELVVLLLDVRPVLPAAEIAALAAVLLALLEEILIGAPGVGEHALDEPLLHGRPRVRRRIDGGPIVGARLVLQPVEPVALGLPIVGVRPDDLDVADAGESIRLEQERRGRGPIDLEDSELSLGQPLRDAEDRVGLARAVVGEDQLPLLAHATGAG